MSVKKIILTGGGTAGHVTPNIALLPSLYESGFAVVYVGSHSGMERELVEACNVQFYPVSSGKLRRYPSMKNVTDCYKVMKGFNEASKIIKKEKPDIIFSKGGFVSVPVVVAGKLQGIPVVIHESDITPGLANKMSYPFADAVCVSFPETLDKTPKGKGFFTGAPIRRMLFHGNKENGLAFCGLKGKKPVLLITGGSLGSVKINESVISALDELLSKFDIIHLCGKGHLKPEIKRVGYFQTEYVSEKLPDILACADIIVSRAGANSINEILALKKPNLLIPLSKQASRGDQILNADSFSTRGYSRVLQDESLTADSLVKNVNELYENREHYIETMKSSQANDGISEVMKVIKSSIK